MNLVHEVFGVDKNLLKSGDIGIEIEVEGSQLPQDVEGWHVDMDGSLRGNSCEFVLNEPLSLSSSMEALDRLEEAYVDHGTDVYNSVRAGVHVHINVQQLTDVELINFMVCYIILEDLLIKYCGETREGNLFCLSTSDAELPLFTIMESIHSGSVNGRFHDDDLRYSAMNLKALSTYGSLEFRSMRGTRDLDEVKEWVQILYGIREAAKQFKQPSDIVNAFSGDRTKKFINAVIPDFKEQLLCEGHSGMLLAGMRRAQDIAYCADWNDWEFKKPKKVKFKKPVFDMDWREQL